MRKRLATSCALIVWLAAAAKAQDTRWIEGMWSDPPATMVGTLRSGNCSDVAIATLSALVDDPKNDSRPFDELLQAALAAHQAYIRGRLLPEVAKGYPPDPADDPSFLNCEPYHGARQMFARHQLEITAIGPDRLELRYGEWNQRRTVYMDGRTRPSHYTPTRLGYSVGHWERNTLVVETAGTVPGWGPGGLPASDQLQIVERYTRGEDGNTLWLTATLTDPKTLKEPLALKKTWRWAPQSEIAPVVDCEKPTSIKRRAESRNER